MKSLRSYLLSAVIAISVFAVSIQPALAATASTYTVQGNVYRVVDYVDSDAERIRLRTVLKGAAANEPYAARVVPITQSRFASWFKPNLGSLIKSNLWWMGFVAIVESAGWAIEELQGQMQVVRPPSGYVPGKYWCEVFHMSQFGYCGPTPFLAAETHLKAHVSTYKGDLQCGAPSGTGWVSCTYLSKDVSYRRSVSVAPVTCGSSNPEGMCGDPSTIYQPVPDADVLSMINSQLALDPAHAATAFTDPATGKGYADLFDPVPYIPGLSAADEALVNCYISGQLQMVDSQTACYVANQAEYDRIKQQTEALASAKTPEATADALNANMKQPITQAQYEESNKKYSDAIADVTASVNAQNQSDYPDIDDKFNELDGIITDLPNTSLPAPADISVPQYVDCQQLTLSDGNGHELVFPSPAQCANIETFKQGFGYFLAISVVFLLCMQLLTRPHG